LNFFFYLLRLRRYKAKRVKTRSFQEGWVSLSQDFRGEGVVTAGAIRCTDGAEIWHGGGPCQISFHRCNNKGIGPSKLTFFTGFDQNAEYKRTAGAYRLRAFQKNYKVCTTFQDAPAVKISLDLLQRLWSYGGFKLT